MRPKEEILNEIKEIEEFTDNYWIPLLQEHILLNRIPPSMYGDVLKDIILNRKKYVYHLKELYDLPRRLYKQDNTRRLS